MKNAFLSHFKNNKYYCPIKNSSFNENHCEHRVFKAYKKKGLLFAITENFYFLEWYEFKNQCLSISYNQVFVSCQAIGMVCSSSEASR